jgi:signal transduction histidine kinase
VTAKNKILSDEKKLIITEDYNTGNEKSFVNADRAQIELAIKNYIVNAVNHTPVGGNIKLTVKETYGYVLFLVFNQGENIEDKDIKKIWDCFYKADPSRNRTDKNSSGIGLYIVRTIITAHKGEYGVNNKKDGVEFWFRLKSE